MVTLRESIWRIVPFTKFQSYWTLCYWMDFYIFFLYTKFDLITMMKPLLKSLYLRRVMLKFSKTEFELWRIFEYLSSLYSLILGACKKYFTWHLGFNTLFLLENKSIFKLLFQFQEYSSNRFWIFYRFSFLLL